MKLFKVKLYDNHNAKEDQIIDGYLGNSFGDGKIAKYSRGEALKKARMFNGKIELTKPDFYDEGLEKLAELTRYNANIIVVQREDGQIVSVTEDRDRVLEMAMDEYCGKDIKLIDLTYNKQQMDFTLIAEITDDEDDVNEFEFTISSTVKY